MSTRAVIARLTNPEIVDEFEGIYVDGDGYPTHTGRTIWKQVHNHFKGDLKAAARYYIDDHPTGWASLGAEGAFGQNECYCHDRGEGVEPGWTRNQNQLNDIPFTYVLTPPGLAIRRYDHPGAVLVKWDAERVDWEAIEKKAIAL